MMAATAERSHLAERDLQALLPSLRRDRMGVTRTQRYLVRRIP